jgi:3-deoxy-manno-octulosonate cytidylyltransferase (CMP-KDO synthetase)
MNPHMVKVVTDNAGYALYFSRARIPFLRGDHDPSVFTGYKRHIGIYAYRVKVLHDFVSWPKAELENLEQLEQLRAIANGIRVHVQKACATIPPGVDTPEDLDKIRAILTAQSR